MYLWTYLLFIAYVYGHTGLGNYKAMEKNIFALVSFYNFTSYFYPSDFFFQPYTDKNSTKAVHFCLRNGSHMLSQ